MNKPSIELENCGNVKITNCTATTQDMSYKNCNSVIIIDGCDTQHIKKKNPKDIFVILLTMVFVYVTGLTILILIKGLPTF